jgi:lysozyme family protein
MPSAAFEASLPFVLRWEGGFVDHPNDPGGRTNKGVTQRVYDAWRKRQGLPVRDVKRLDDTELHRIYESGYWIPPTATGWRASSTWCTSTPP